MGERGAAALSGLPGRERPPHPRQPHETYVSGPTVLKYCIPFTVTLLVYNFFGSPERLTLLWRFEAVFHPTPTHTHPRHPLPPLELPSSPPPFPSLCLSPSLFCPIADLFLRPEVFWADFHLHSFEGVARPVPAVPGDAIQVLVVLPEEVVHAVEVGVRAAVVPVSTWAGTRSALVCPRKSSHTRQQAFVILTEPEPREPVSKRNTKARPPAARS